MKIDIKGAIISNDEKYIYDYYDMDSTCPRDVQKILDLANGQSIDIYINSGGGDIFAGSEIYSIISTYKGDVRMHVVGIAASAASVIMCASKSDIASTAMVMVHNVSSVARGDYNDMDKQSDILKKANKSIASAYVAKTGMTENEALTMMENETWLTASEAVEKGLIDKIAEVNNLKLVASYDNQMLPPSVVEKAKNIINNSQNSELSDADIFVQKTAQSKLNLLKLKGEIK